MEPEITVNLKNTMGFKEAFELLKQGKLIKLPSWGGYWKWECEDGGDWTIMMYLRQGSKMDIRDSNRMEYTISNLLSDEWMEATEANCALLRGELSL